MILGLQTSFKFEHKETYLREDFFVSSSNRAAFEAVCGHEWDFFCMIVIGEDGRGKTHLSKIWADSAEDGDVAEIELTEDFAEIVINHRNFVLRLNEKLSPQEEQNLFHLYNMVRERMGKLLITSTLEIDELTTLPDLRSRLKIAHKVHIETPDDELVKLMIMKQFSNHQMKVSSDVVEYMLKRVERNGKAIKHLVEVIEANSKGKNINLNNIKNYFPTA